ncbi:hypothetical protein [aff. Roholtiella sp. LEGE 12411]|nr:hypothetical protein [aff. Roholtiella sp. LEGE 12411]
MANLHRAWDMGDMAWGMENDEWARVLLILNAQCPIPNAPFPNRITFP